MKTHVQKWGNSLAVRLPKHIVREIGLDYNSTVEMNVEEGKLILQRSDEIPTLESLLSKVTKDNLHEIVDTGKPTGNEAW